MTVTTKVLKVKLGLYALFCLDPFFSLWEKSKISDEQDFDQALNSPEGLGSKTNDLLEFYEPRIILKLIAYLLTTYTLQTQVILQKTRGFGSEFEELQTFFTYFDEYKFLFFSSDLRFLETNKLFNTHQLLGSSSQDLNKRQERYPLPILSLLCLEDLVQLF